MKHFTNFVIAIISGIIAGSVRTVKASFVTAPTQFTRYHEVKSFGSGESSSFSTLETYLRLSEIPLPPGRRPAPKGGDMAYMKTNIVKQMDNYLAIRKVGGIDSINDVYARDSSTNIWWFVGKVARCTGTVSLDNAVQRQWNLIEEHATRLRPIELGRKFGELEIWTALGDSELHIANQIANYKMDHVDRFDCDESIARRVEVGFNCEVVTNQGEGFRVERENDGGPILFID